MKKTIFDLFNEQNPVERKPNSSNSVLYDETEESEKIVKATSERSTPKQETETIVESVTENETVTNENENEKGA